MKYNLGVIGFGNIARAIVTPILDKKLLEPSQIFCLVRSKSTYENIKESYNHNINLYLADSSDKSLVWDCPVKIISVKPQQLEYIRETIQ